MLILTHIKSLTHKINYDGVLGFWGALARERAKEKEQARKDDTRRKILIGSCMLKITEEDEQARAKLIAQMDKYLMDERDRKLFDLPAFNY